MYRVVLFNILIALLILFTPRITLCEENNLPGLFDIPKLKVLGFSDASFEASFSDSGNDDTFSIGHVSLFITSEIASSVNFVFESEFHSNAKTNSMMFHPERINISYSFSDIFNIKVGRMHTPLGYWNQAFHHGTWLQSTIYRPQIYLWEDDDGGFLPVHSFGVEIFGLLELVHFDLSYSFDVLNGRGKTKSEIQMVEDKNDSKAFNVLLGIKPYSIEGLKLGANIYLDTIPPDPGVTERINRIEERIFGGFVTYRHDGLELLGEVFYIYHDDKTSGNDFDTIAFYFQAGYELNKITSYYRFDFLDFESGDIYFLPDNIDSNKHTFGIRWDIFNWNALKFEYCYNDKGKSDEEHSIRFNTSFVF